MISRKSEVFKYINRGKESVTVLLPGWATEYRIFDALDLNTDYIVPLDFWPFGFEVALLEALERYGIKKISLLGCSMGGFVAAEFASKHRELTDALTLIGIRRRYKKDEMLDVRRNLKKNRKAYLYKFYNWCFHDAHSVARFKERLLDDYMEEFDLDCLLKTLDYLEGCELRPEALKDIDRIKIIHGEYDRIAPIAEALDVKNNLPQAEFVTVKGAGHIPLYKHE